jgi:hypothetical protein
MSITATVTISKTDHWVLTNGTLLPDTILAQLARDADTDMDVSIETSIGEAQQFHYNADEDEWTDEDGDPVSIEH